MNKLDIWGSGLGHHSAAQGTLQLSRLLANLPSSTPLCSSQVSRVLWGTRVGVGVGSAWLALAETGGNGQWEDPISMVAHACDPSAGAVNAMFKDSLLHIVSWKPI